MSNSNVSDIEPEGFAAKLFCSHGGGKALFGQGLVPEADQVIQVLLQGCTLAYPQLVAKIRQLILDLLPGQDFLGKPIPVALHGELAPGIRRGHSFGGVPVADQVVAEGPLLVSQTFARIFTLGRTCHAA
jgi:hypothetical protein